MNLLALVVGFFLFGAEYLFIYTLQGFLSSLELVTLSSTSLPTWYPEEPYINIALLFMVALLRVGTLSVKKYLGGYMNHFLLRKFRTKFFRFSIFDKKSTSTHEMINLFTDNLGRVGSFQLHLTYLIISVSSVVFLFISGFVIAPQAMLVGTIGIFFFIYPVRALDEKIRNLGGELSKSWNQISKNLVDGMRNRYFFKAHGLEELVVKNGSAAIRSFELNNRKFFIYVAIKNAVPSIAGIIILICIAHFNFKTSQVESSEIVALLYMFLRVSQGVGESSTLMSHLYLNYPSVINFLKWNDRIESNSDTINSASSTLRGKVTQTNSKDFSITSRDISFEYENLKVFDQLSFDLLKGDVLVVKGSSGAGKSTLISLLLGINSPSAGSLTLNGKPLNKEIVHYRDQISYVGPDPLLFIDTIRGNLLYGNEEASKISDELIYETLSKVGLVGFVENKREKLDFILNQDSEASTGQRQRLSLARALLRKPTFLIMDEATANLDSQIEKQILNDILNERKKMLIIIVTHKPHLSAYGNKIIDLDERSVKTRKDDLPENFK